MSRGCVYNYSPQNVCIGWATKKYLRQKMAGCRPSNNMFPVRLPLSLTLAWILLTFYYLDHKIYRTYNALPYGPDAAEESVFWVKYPDQSMRKINVFYGDAVIIKRDGTPERFDGLKLFRRTTG